VASGVKERRISGERAWEAAKAHITPAAEVKQAPLCGQEIENKREVQLGCTG
jgi:hypothetical protein